MATTDDAAGMAALAVALVTLKRLIAKGVLNPQETADVMSDASRLLGAVDTGADLEKARDLLSLLQLALHPHSRTADRFGHARRTWPSRIVEDSLVLLLDRVPRLSGDEPDPETLLHQSRSFAKGWPLARAPTPKFARLALPAAPGLRVHRWCPASECLRNARDPLSVISSSTLHRICFGHQRGAFSFLLLSKCVH